MVSGLKLFDLKGKTALITGSSQGIGYALANGLAEAGSDIILNGRNIKKLKQSAVSINTKQMIFQLCFDVTDYEQVKQSIDKFEQEIRPIDILINNAGITGKNATVWDYPLDEWEKVLNINLHSTFYCCKAIAPHMIKNNYGRIVNIASISGKEGNANASAYSTAKAGVIGLTKSLGKELADKNIAVNAVTPTTANTRILEQMTKKHVDFMLSKVPRNRYLELEEIASLVAWLSSSENSFSTGAIFDISGGRATY